MVKQYQSVRGMNDITPQETPHWQYLERVMHNWLRQYGYSELRFPIVESTELFRRTIGDVTDIVEKEMYTFDDRSGDSLSLRPEGTAGAVRAGIQHDLLFQKTPRLWYMGPMFRYEKPQSERYRQFHQLGVEAFGMDGPEIDAELIVMTQRLWRELDLTNVTLHINSLGSVVARHAYRDELVGYFQKHIDALDEDSRRRLASNPMRILDSKNPALRDIVARAPVLADFLDADAREHFAGLCDILDQMGIAYVKNPRLVRGLDYYNKTVFEWLTADLGAQGAICAGGRYDGLVEQLGGRETPAAGFAIGLERVLRLVEKQGKLPPAPSLDAYLVAVGSEARTSAWRLIEMLRERLPDFSFQLDCTGGSFKSQVKKADRSGAAVALIVGDDEARAAQVAVKFLRLDAPQEMVGIDDAATRLRAWRDEGKI